MQKRKLGELTSERLHCKAI